jgi:hypothetical protein
MAIQSTATAIDSTLLSVHPFSHIMDGPYKLVGFSTPESREELNSQRKSEGKLYTTNTSCGGTCDHCGTAISIVCTIEGANGRFKVGSTCVEKAAQSPEIVNKVKHLVKQRTAQLNKDRQVKQYVQAIDWIEENSESLAILPHPKNWNDSSLLNFLQWYRANAGKAKFIATVKKYTEWKPAK